MLEVPYGADQVGVIHDRAAGTYTVAIAVRAGAFGLLDGAEQERKLDAWGSVLASLARDGSPVRRLQWIERTLPAPRRRAGRLPAGRARPGGTARLRPRRLLHRAGRVGGSGDPRARDSARPADRRAPGRSRAAAPGRRRGGAPASWRCARPRAWPSGCRSPRSRSSGCCARAATRRRSATPSIPSGARVAIGAALGDPEREGVDPALMGPLADETSWGAYRTDSAHHATYWISELAAHRCRRRHS